MKQTKSTIEERHRQIIKNPGDLNLKSYYAHKELEDKLRKAGIVRSDRGPKISDHAHMRTAMYR